MEQLVKCRIYYDMTSCIVLNIVLNYISRARGKSLGTRLYASDWLMDDLRFRLNFNLSKKNENYHHSQKERLGISNIAKFGCEML